MSDKLRESQRDIGLVDNFSIRPIPTANLWGWWKASDAFTDAGKTTKCSASGVDACYTLEDRSGNGRDLINATLANRPLWYSKQLSGYPTLRFNGTSSELGLGSLSLAQPISFYVVYKPIVWGSGTRDVVTFDTTGAGLRLQHSSSTMIVTAGTTGVTGVDDVVGAYALDACVINGSSSKLQQNSNAILTGGSGTGSLSKVFIGSGDAQQWTNCDICEVIVYSAAHDLTAATAIAVRRYLSDKYNLGIIF